MSIVVVNDEKLKEIANAIREQNGFSITYTPGQMPEAIDKIGENSINLDSLKVITPPNKVNYKEGETFDAAGLVVEANYTNTAHRTNIVPTVTPSGPLTLEDTKVSLSFEELGIIKSVDQNISVLTGLFNWGDENAVGDDAWWMGLKDAIPGMSESERAACLGKTKRVSLSTSVLGSNQVIMRCVGYDLDGEGTLTFAAVNALAQEDIFDNDRVGWHTSTIAARCKDFYNACSAKNAIKIVSKGTCYSHYTGDARNDTPIYKDETVFLLSERELGLNRWSPISTSNSNVNKAECTKGYNEPYQWFNSNERRKVTLGDANGNPTGGNIYWWERSLDYSSKYNMCGVSNGGTAYYGRYHNDYGVLPAFAIG